MGCQGEIICLKSPANAMDILNYIISNWGLIVTRTGEHVAIVAVAVALAS
jgi:hypothetical protein